MIVGEFSSRALFVEDTIGPLGAGVEFQSVEFLSNSSKVELDETVHPPEVAVLDADDARWLVLWFRALARGVAVGVAWFRSPTTTERVGVEFRLEVDK